MLDSLFQMSVEWSLALQQITWLAPVMSSFTLLANEEFYLMVMPVLVWAVDYRFGLRVGVMLLLTSGLNSVFKIAFHQPRPYWYDGRVQNLSVPATDFGIPSGHSQTPMSVFGLIAASLKRVWLTILLGFVIFMIGLSRIYLGVHMQVDVLTGWLLGGLMVWGFIKLEGKVSAWFANKTFAAKIGAVFAVSMILVLLGWLAVLSLGDYKLPQEWVTNAQIAHPEEALNPTTLNGVMTSAGAFFGLGLGAIWLTENGGFNAASGPWWKRVLRFLIGLIGMVILWKGLGDIFPRYEDLVSYSLRYFRYALIGLWATGAAPLLFIRIKLGEPAETE